MLVVNVTWRNKTYVGTLLDCTRHDWAPPRYTHRATHTAGQRCDAVATPEGRDHVWSCTSGFLHHVTQMLCKYNAVYMSEDRIRTDK